MPFFVKNQVFKNKHTVYSTVSGLFESLFYIEKKTTERNTSVTVCNNDAILKNVGALLPKH